MTDMKKPKKAKTVKPEPPPPMLSGGKRRKPMTQAERERMRDQMLGAFMIIEGFFKLLGVKPPQGKKRGRPKKAVDKPDVN